MTLATGIEVGSDIAKLGPDQFRVVNYTLGDKVSWGAGAGTVIQGQSYSGPGIRRAIAHTHPVDTAFSYWKGSCWCNGKWEGSLYRGDLERARSSGVNSYAAGRMMKDGTEIADSYISAESYFFEVP